MQFPKPTFIAVAIMTCISTSIFLVANHERNIEVIARSNSPIDLSMYEMPLNNHNGAVPAKKRIAPLIRLDNSKHLAPLQNLVKGRILLDFHATWCGPCKKQSLILEDIANNEDLCGAVMLKIDIDKHPELAKLYNVTTVPKLVVVKKGNVIVEQAGLATKEQILIWLQDSSVDQLAQAISTQ